ncbi:hypothetical protein SARC_05678 [Sphaeroforma arctica JP610]|uniref:Uncharacterized protein n=1 Tax=Sphaeroforma arctica JP610 TaxID=667725 RepID=A0A0L0G1D8_9EUKA|nr:hypothetical protein SARC_05678 [Sphaeroforma arctica JP610]KNC82018.1 hypothetical protein SARC_05678 [Sphaeroforma arctica JP610]|eukprot:XP_014155920.1 hypothetical protein SARC_05678 [Sphaeroforma arctica JP610]
MSDGRTYTSVSVESCAETSFQALVWSSDVFPACDDLVTISINIADLEGVCTFSQSDVIESNTLYRQYRGSVVVVYSESVPVTSGSSTTRTSTFTLPIDIKLQGNVAATTTTTTDVAVFSAFDLQAAISGLVISDGAPTSLVYISYGLPYPYSVTSFNPTLTLSGGTLVQSAVVTSPVSAERCNHAGATEYSYANNVCFKTLGIDITHGSSCTLDGIYTINTVGVNCGDNVPASDCPLAAEDTSSSVSFTLVSENFCDGMGLNAIIDDAVTIAEFTTFHEEDVQSGTPTTQRAFLFGEDVWFKMSFVGLKIFSVAMDSLVTDLNANDHKFTMVDAGTNLGFDVETQLYWFKHEITESFVGADPGPGNSQSAVVTVTITTSYEEPVRRRRRRRRAVSRSSQDMVNEGTHNERDKNRIHVGRARGRRISFDDLKPNNPGVYEPIDGEDILDDVPVKQNSIQDNVGEVVEMNEETKDTNEDVYDTLDLKPNDVVGATTTATPSSTKEPPTKSDTTPTPSGSGTTEPDGNADTAERQSKNTTPTPSPLVLTPNIPTGSSFVEVEKGEVVVEKVQTGEIDETGGDSTGNSTEKGIADGSVFVIRGDEDVEFVFHNNVPLGTSPTPKPEVTTTVSESDVDNDDLYGAGDKLVETGQGSVSTQFKFEGVIGKPLVWDTDISPGASITQGEQIVLRKRRSTDQMRKRRLRGQINI